VDTPSKETKEKKKFKIAPKKIFWFVVGWFTIPYLTGGIWYDMFGGLTFSQMLLRLLHPRELISALGIYTLTFILFPFLPKRFSKANIFIRLFYFIIFYIILNTAIKLIF